MIDQAQREGRLTALGVVISEFTRSLCEPWMEAPNGSDGARELDALTAEIKKATADARLATKGLHATLNVKERIPLNYRSPGIFSGHERATAQSGLCNCQRSRHGRLGVVLSRSRPLAS